MTTHFHIERGCMDSMNGMEQKVPQFVPSSMRSLKRACGWVSVTRVTVWAKGR